MITYKGKKIKMIYKRRIVAYQTIHLESLIIKQKSFLQHIENWRSFGKKERRKFAKLREQGFYTFLLVVFSLNFARFHNFPNG